MKILHVYPDYDHMGSLERRILLLCEQCQALPDMELIVACTEGGQLQYALERLGIATIGLYSPDCFKNPHLRALDLKSYWQAKQIADNIQPDLVHVHAGGAENLIWRLLGLPTVLTLHGYSSLSSKVAPLSPIKRSVDALFRTLFCWSARWMNGVTCVSWAEVERLSQEGYIPDDKPVHIIPSGLPMATFQATIAKNRFLYDPTHLMPDYTPGDPVIAWIGRLEPEKQPDLFLALARQLSASFPKAWWLLIGEGSLKAALEEHVHGEPIPRLLMPGFLPVDSVLAFSSVLVHTPKTDGFGMVVLQAMAAGVPVASFPLGGVCDLLEKMSECLTPSSSLLDLATTVRALLSLNAEARVQLSAAMIRHASQHYDADKLLLQWLGLYQQMLEGDS